jgi:rhodanese-related sulfurtransferase
MSRPRWVKLLVAFLAILGALLPLVLYWWVLGRVPTLVARDTIEMLNQADANAILVDVRDATAFKAKHLQVAQNWPLENIAAVSSRDQVPARFRDKTLLLICNAGFSSADATRRLLALGLNDVYNVRGGMQAWIAAENTLCTKALCMFETFDKATESAFRATAGHEQWIGTIAGFVIKPIYMISSVILAWILRRQRALDLVSLRWALVLFFAGEACCMVYTLAYLFFHLESYLFEYLHNYGMVLAFGFTAFAVMEGLDTRGVKLSEPGKRCAMLELCGPCIKYEDAPCGARRLFLLMTPFAGILSAMPFLAPFNTMTYNTFVLGTFYTYSHPVIHQVFEIRYCPTLAITLFGLSLIVLLVKKDKPAPLAGKLFFAAGMGALGFGMFRLLLGAVFENNLVWFDFWEEITELLYMASVGCVLWIFRRRLFQKTSRLPQNDPVEVLTFK